MRSVLSVVLPALGVVSLAQAAVPEVTAVRATSPTQNSPCTQYPSHGQKLLKVRVAMPDDNGLDGLAITRDSGDDIYYTSLIKSNRVVKTGFSCHAANEGIVEVGADLTAALTVAEEGGNHYISTGEGYLLEPYWLFVNGTQLPGIYMGAQNQTVWGFHLNQAATLPCGKGDEYSMRLQGLPLVGEPVTVDEPEVYGFLQAVEYLSA